MCLCSGLLGMLFRYRTKWEGPIKSQPSKLKDVRLRCLLNKWCAIAIGDELQITRYAKVIYIIWVVVSNMFNVHPKPWGNDPIWLIVFKWVGSTTNYLFIFILFLRAPVHRYDADLLHQAASTPVERPGPSCWTSLSGELVVVFFKHVVLRKCKVNPSKKNIEVRWVLGVFMYIDIFIYWYVFILNYICTTVCVSQLNGFFCLEEMP